MSLGRYIYRILLVSRITFFSWFRVQQVLVGVFLTSILYIAVFGLVMSRLIDEKYILFILPGVVAIYAATLTIIPIGTIVHTAMGRSELYLYAIPIPRSGIIASRLIVAILIVEIASAVSIFSYWIILAEPNYMLFIATLPAVPLTVAISLMYIALAFIIRDPPKYFTIVSSIAGALIVLSTAYYPVEAFRHFPDAFIALVELNPVSVASDLGRAFLGIYVGDPIQKTYLLILEAILISALSIRVTARRLER